MTQGYEIVRKLGEGSYGIVYEAEHIKLKRRVALKRLRPEMRGRSDVVERLFREAEVCAKLSHPNIVAVHDTGEDQQGPFIIFELLVGETLADRGLRQGTLPPLEVLDIVSDALLGLAAAHSQGVVHRDIKPANLFLCAQATGVELVKLLDFGVSKQPDRKSLTGLTRPGEVVGSLAFMSREQMHQKDIDGRADLYSLGVCMYLMVAGKKPFDAATVQDLLFLLNQPPVPLARHVPSLSAAFCEVVHRALERDRTKRYDSALAMRDAVLAARQSLLSPVGVEGTSTTLVVAPAHARGVGAAPTIEATRTIVMPGLAHMASAADGSSRHASPAHNSTTASITAKLTLEHVRPPAMPSPISVVELDPHELTTDITPAIVLPSELTTDITPAIVLPSDEPITAVDSARRVFDLATMHFDAPLEEQQHQDVMASLKTLDTSALASSQPATMTEEPATRILSTADIGLAPAPSKPATRSERALMQTGPSFAFALRHPPPTKTSDGERARNRPLDITIASAKPSTAARKLRIDPRVVVATVGLSILAIAAIATAARC